MKAYLVMDGAWGSCGKGLIAGKLALDRKPDVVVCNFGPNAGHTFINKEMNIMTQQLPTGIINPDAKILIGPGAIIDPAILLAEMEKFSIDQDRVIIHPHAAVVTTEDKRIESKTMGAIGSTKKGVGSALCRKVSRTDVGLPNVAKDCHELRYFTKNSYLDILRDAELVQIESAQGFELSLNHGTTYPQVTSRDITPEAILNDVGVPRRFLTETIVALRTYPIRVGHEYCPDGKIISHSGPVYPDQDELTWKDIPMAGEERTTVTNKVRRLFTWSWEQFNQMMYFVGPCSIFINFLNYQEKENQNHFLFLLNLEAIKNYSKIKWEGRGPAYENIIEKA